MKRSEINHIIQHAKAFFAEFRFALPPFAAWSPDDWRKAGPEARPIVEQALGWDITDFGGGDFERLGLFLFTVRNGTLAELDKPHGRTYAEKIMIVREDQVTPVHCHDQKMEDIINRGGGELVMKLWNDDGKGGLADTDVELLRDGLLTTVPAGEPLHLSPGESVCLVQRVWHSFWGAPGKGTVLVGEVSRVNDDHTDNVFLEPIGRFPTIEEDEPPLHLLCGDYPRYYAHA